VPRRCSSIQVMNTRIKTGGCKRKSLQSMEGKKAGCRLGNGRNAKGTEGMGMVLSTLSLGRGGGDKKVYQGLK